MGEPVAELWDPCSIPAEALVGAGVNPTRLGSETNSANGVAEASFCSYATDSFQLTVYSFRSPIEARSSPAEVRDEIDIGDRRATRFSRSITPTWVSCIVGFNARSSSVELEARPDVNAPSDENSCSVATELAQSLLPQLPR
ncbi:DUF3558 domain-containing protein [Rhodococcoides corynebacterioides]|uniref:DUF3558 domain-containing protein n=1 Tax=Rhodococcoides corynebacterioides TaxID=53972 RepID=UPI001C9B7616|nr:DUF3558 domain-containing protein [Rhodococcus corynebacterioides]MBY6350871.1 hypothetical protein [Rhodococcus corynebacterioides]